MFYREITDWDDAYANPPNIPRAERWPGAWVEAAQSYRQQMLDEGRARLDEAYGPAERNRHDLFLPKTKPRGLVIFVHGGYWRRFDKSYWSHLAKGANERGFAVAIPSYTLCPQIRISGIVEEIANAVTHFSDTIEGPVHLAGHSAGGHLVTRLVSHPSPLPEAVRERIAHVLSISGVHDLRPLMRLELNGELQIDEAEALAHSPALLPPLPRQKLTCWVGAAERAEFVRQNALLANIWTGLGARTAVVEEPDRHHFDVVDGLCAPDSAMMDCLLAP